MYCFEDRKPQARADSNTQQPLVLDGTVYLDYVDEEPSQENGLLLLLKQYLGAKPD